MDPKYHPKIIGRKGAVITNIRTEHDVNIQFPEKNDESQVWRVTAGISLGKIMFCVCTEDGFCSNFMKILQVHVEFAPVSQDQITITGYEHKAIAARDAIQAIVDELEEMISEDITLDSRVHARIIGARGKGIRKIMDEFKVKKMHLGIDMHGRLGA